MSDRPAQVVVAGGFDDVRSAQIRLLEEASRLGDVTVLLWSDDSLLRLTGKAPKFPFAERKYLLDGIRYVASVRQADAPQDPHSLPAIEGYVPEVWVVGAADHAPGKKAFCASQGLAYRVLKDRDLRGFPVEPVSPSVPPRKKVVVTGCYDWFHTGHVRFFEEVSEYGDLYVIVGHDENIRLLKGEGHPLFGQEERRYLVASIRFVTQALVSSGMGWLDADPEIRQLKPDLYAVNEDGDKGGKREYCEKLGIGYLVLKRTPAAGLTRRTSTDLRGF
jgi:cytidyltransferase-like protein